ncbi:MAG: hypothetical protein ACI9U2_002951 [Bradymonadia bacterium]|jgi:hypothetical protein
MRFLISLSFAAAGLLAATAACADVGLELTYESGGFSTLLKVVEPEGTTCTINGIKKHSAPFAFNAQPHMYYALSCLLPNGQVWQRKIEAKKGKIGVIKLRMAKNPGTVNTGLIAPIAAVAPPPVVIAAGPTPMTPRAFSALIRSLKQASFSSDKINVVKAAAVGNHFTIAQLGQLVDASTHSSDKVKTAEIIAPKIVDKQNAFQLGAHFTFSSDKDKVLTLFR